MLGQSNYPGRDDVWVSLPGPMRSKIATATANIWLTGFSEGKHGPAPERTLSDAIIALAQEAPCLTKTEIAKCNRSMLADLPSLTGRSAQLHIRAESGCAAWNPTAMFCGLPLPPEQERRAM